MKSRIIREYYLEFQKLKMDLKNKLNMVSNERGESNGFISFFDGRSGTT